jgi:hypothetical protein
MTKELNFFAEIDRVTRELYKEENEAKPLGNYSVWVGGCEEHTYLTYAQALALKNEYLEDGYDDVEIDTYEEDTK